jgi:hypothetical protein
VEVTVSSRVEVKKRVPDNLSTPSLKNGWVSHVLAWGLCRVAIGSPATAAQFLCCTDRVSNTAITPYFPRTAYICKWPLKTSCPFLLFSFLVDDLTKRNPSAIKRH